MGILERIELYVKLRVRDFLDRRWTKQKWIEWSTRTGLEATLNDDTLFHFGFYKAVAVDEVVWVIGAPTSAAWRESVVVEIDGARVSIEDRSVVPAEGFTLLILTNEARGRSVQVTLGRNRLNLAIEYHNQVQSPRDSIMAVTLCQDDIEYLPFWTSHYLDWGVTEFLIGYNGLNNASFGHSSRTTLVDWPLPYHFKSHKIGKFCPHFAQPPFLQYALAVAKAKGVDWILAMDLDEYVFHPSNVEDVKRLSDEITFSNVWARGVPASPSSSMSIQYSHHPSQNRSKAMRRVSVTERLSIHGNADSKPNGAFFHLEHLSGATSIWRDQEEIQFTEMMSFELAAKCAFWANIESK